MTIEESMQKLAEILNGMSGTVTQQLSTTQEQNGFLQNAISNITGETTSGGQQKPTTQQVEQRSMATMNAQALEGVVQKLDNILSVMRQTVNQLLR